MLNIVISWYLGFKINWLYPEKKLIRKVIVYLINFSKNLSILGSKFVL